MLNMSKHKKIMKKFSLPVIAAAIMGLGISSQSFAVDKAAFVYIGPTSDHGWTYSHDQGRIKAEKLWAENLKRLTSKMYLKRPMLNV